MRPVDRHRRARAVTWGITIAGLLLVALLVRLQVVASDPYVERGRQQRLVERPLLATRGSILDRNGEVLSMSLPAKAVVVNPRQVEEPERVAARLAPALGLETAAVQRILESPDTGFAYVARQLDPEVGERVAAMALPGISIVDETRRVPAADDLGLSIVGRINSFGEDPYGLEEQYDDRLRGTDGERSSERAGDGTTIVGTDEVDALSTPGDQLTLTIDRSLQFWAESVLRDQVTAVGAKGGTVVVGRPGTGEVLAMATVVRKDSGVAPSRLNTAVRTYEPGSVMKVVTASAAFEEAVVQPETVFTVPSKIKVADKVINDAEKHATKDMTVQEIISHSSNVGTIKVAQLLGRERILDYLDRFGFGEATTLGLDKEQAGGFRREWYGSDIGSIPIGQSITATPLQVWAAYNTIANAGTYVAPRIVDRWTDPTGTVTRPEAPAPRRVVSPEAAAKVTAALEQVVEEGTGKKWAIPGYRIAAKTGTSYQPLGGGKGYGTAATRHYAASFAGFFPATNPEISIMVMIDDPEYGNHFGAEAAGPVFDRLAKESMRRYGIAPDGSQSATTATPGRAKPARAPVSVATAPAPPPAAGATIPTSTVPTATVPTTTVAPSTPTTAPRPNGRPPDGDGPVTASDLASAPPPDAGE